MNSHTNIINGTSTSRVRISRVKWTERSSFPKKKKTKQNRALLLTHRRPPRHRRYGRLRPPPPVHLPQSSTSTTISVLYHGISHWYPPSLSIYTSPSQPLSSTTVGRSATASNQNHRRRSCHRMGELEVEKHVNYIFSVEKKKDDFESVVT
ncbi:uncharacterized protein LOC114318091 [Camellia sinensis]|uniref:uncharacterized protein LOC114318091 n=1 Tax=Camellia sinensis TaxID=4442 RepID=UPI0010355E29|nr:uncharacterized protein LOC114318091 [Camellia sinensis]